jgi:hypothetical protein
MDELLQDLNALVQRGLIAVDAIVDGEPTYRLSPALAADVVVRSTRQTRPARARSRRVRNRG